MTEQYAILLENGRFRRLDKQSMVLQKLLPRHTGRKFVYEHLSIINVSLDSMNQLVKNQLIAKIDLSSTSSFFVLLQDHTTEQKRLHEKYLTNLIFLPPEQDSINITTTLPPPWGGPGWGFNPRIPILQHKLQQTQTRNRLYYHQLLTRERDIQQLKQQIRQASDMPTQERYYQQLESLRKSKLPQPDPEAERNLAIEIAQLQKQEYLKNQERLAKQALQLQEDPMPPTLLSGTITFVTII